jgi:hypothetical protein
MIDAIENLINLSMVDNSRATIDKLVKALEVAGNAIQSSVNKINLAENPHLCLGYISAKMDNALYDIKTIVEKTNE